MKSSQSSAHILVSSVRSLNCGWNWIDLNDQVNFRVLLNCQHYLILLQSRVCLCTYLSHTLNKTEQSDRTARVCVRLCSAQLSWSVQAELWIIKGWDRKSSFGIEPTWITRLPLQSAIQGFALRFTELSALYIYTQTIPALWNLHHPTRLWYSLALRYLHLIYLSRGTSCQ